MNSNERVNKNDELSSLTTIKRPKSVGLHMGNPIRDLPGMVYLCPSLSTSFSDIPYKTRYVFAFLEDEEGGVCEVYPGTNEVYVHVAVSEVEYKQVLKDLEVEEAKQRRKRGEIKETAPRVKFDQSQVDPKIFSQLPSTAWTRVRRRLDEETRPSKHATNTSLNEVLRRAGFTSLKEVQDDVLRRTPKSEEPETSSKTSMPALPRIESSVSLPLSSEEMERRQRISEAVKAGWARRRERMLSNGTTSTNGSEDTSSPEPGEEGLTKRQIGQRRRWQKVNQALLLNRAPQPDEPLKGRVLVLDIQSEKAGYIDVRNASLSGLELSIKFPGTFRLVERIYGGVLWLCLESNDKVGLPSVEFWALTRKAPHGVRVVITT